jgi:hypothetical protein
MCGCLSSLDGRMVAGRGCVQYVTSQFAQVTGDRRKKHELQIPTQGILNVISRHIDMETKKSEEGALCHLCVTCI